MSNLTRFPLSYDTEADADIHELIQSIPTKRRSGRLRYLIRLGLAAEQGINVSQQTVAVETEMGHKSTTDTPRRQRLTFSPGE